MNVEKYFKAIFKAITFVFLNLQLNKMGTFCCWWDSNWELGTTAMPFAHQPPAAPNGELYNYGPILKGARVVLTEDPPHSLKPKVCLSRSRRSDQCLSKRKKKFA